MPLRSGFLYLMAILDWYSRYVLRGGYQNSLETDFCLEALEEALARSQPKIFNTDQGVPAVRSHHLNRSLPPAGMSRRPRRR